MSLEDRLHPFLSSYIGWPQWVKSLLGNAYGLIPLSWRRGHAYGAFADLLRDKSPAAIEQRTRAALGATLAWALDTVPAYAAFRHLAPQSVQDDPFAVLAQLPVVSKADYKTDLSRYLSTRMPSSARLKTFTGGSTANPMMFYLQKGVTRPREYAFMEDFHARVGLGDKDMVLAMRGRTVPSAARAGGKLWMYEPIKRQLILSSDHLETRFMPAYEEALRQFHPPYIQAFPSALYPLVRWLAEHPLPEFTEQVRGIMLYSENVPEFQMRLIRQVFGCPILKHYGHSERVLMAATLPDDDRYHFWPQYGYFELLNEAGTPVTRPGELGEIVGTSFDNRVMPFVRYRTGDMAMLSDNPPTLPGYPVVERIEGRLQEFIVTRDHRLISICTMGAAHFDELANVDAIQYEQQEPGRFVLKVVARTPIDDAMRHRIAHAVEEKTQHGCTADIVQVESIPRTLRGKHVMLVQHLDISRYLGAARGVEK